MSFVKLDVGILDSTLWVDKDSRDVFITALLMATPKEIEQPLEQIKVSAIEYTGFIVPPGWYGFVPAAGPGIIRRCGIDEEAGMQALERLGSPDQSSRSQAFDGRRLVRVNGGYLILNYMAYREKDHTAAERMRRFRERKRSVTASNAQSVTRNVNNDTRNDTQADAEADTEADTQTLIKADAVKGFVKGFVKGHKV